MPSTFLRTRLIQSKQNAWVKELRSGFAHSAKTERGYIAIEGEHLLLEALASSLELGPIFVKTGNETLLDRLPLPAAAEILELPPEIFTSAVDTEAPQGIAALVSPPVFTLDQIFATDRTPLLVVSAGLQDPGNLGTLIRSAEALGATGFVLLPGTVSLYNQKTLRASAGSIFRLPVITAKPNKLFKALKGRQIAAAVATGGSPAVECDFTQPTALILGNEGNGIPEEILQQANTRVTIPTPGPVESLNAAVAGSILLYEASRQRMVSGRPQ
jgi:RNA methyltransferase, TrmH family